MRKSILATCLAASLFSLSALTASAESNDQEMVKVWSIDFSGHPPFKRRLIELPATDLALMEASDEIIEFERVWTVDFSGKPPFKRRFEEVPVIDAASLELNETESSTRRKPLGSIKRHR